MRAILLAAGKATRLGELSVTTPKCLHKVGGETLLDRVVGQLRAAGVEEFLINTHHLAELVWDHVSRSPWGDHAMLVHEEELLGTLGTLRANADFYEGAPGWVLHADNFIQGPLTHVRRAFDLRPVEAWGAMLTFEAAHPESCGVVVLDSGNMVTEFFEKVSEPPSRTASAATFLFDHRAVQLAASLSSEATDISRDLIPVLIGRLLAVPAHGQVIDIGTPEGLAAARVAAQAELRA